MTRVQLIEGFGEPSQTERTLTRNGERETLIYGSKSRGSYFHVVQDVVVKAVIR